MFLLCTIEIAYKTPYFNLYTSALVLHNLLSHFMKRLTSKEWSKMYFMPRGGQGDNDSWMWYKMTQLQYLDFEGGGAGIIPPREWRN